jgi:phosphate transport system substrate-binding protein
MIEKYLSCISWWAGIFIIPALFCIIYGAKKIKIGTFEIEIPEADIFGFTQARIIGFIMISIGAVIAFNNILHCQATCELKIKVSGSITMSNIVSKDLTKFQKKYPNSIGTYTYEKGQKMLGSEIGLKDLAYNDANIAAISRELTQNEKKQGLVSKVVGTDDIAVFIGKENPLVNEIIEKGLTLEKLKSIYEGKISNWDSLGLGVSKLTKKKIQVWNNNPNGATRTSFQKLVMKEANFGEEPNFHTPSTDSISSWIYTLESDGIGYASSDFVSNQDEIRIIPIIYNDKKIKPGQSDYPIRRDLHYVYKKPDDCSVKAFIETVAN